MDRILTRLRDKVCALDGLLCNPKINDPMWHAIVENVWTEIVELKEVDGKICEENTEL